ncbi:MAG: DUF4082 domain-containing protein [Verrucomicrobiaceae bacterium]|nr:DUF4082 domain-containing protein [Verrucomicrobiaceae bacterium]
MPAHSHAATALSFSSYTGSFTDGVGRVIGWEFSTTAAPVQVTHLGFFDEGANGLASSHAVGLYLKSTKALVASVIVPAGTSASLDGFFRMESITPVSLLPATEYVIAASWAANSDPWLWDDGLLGVSMNDLVISPLITAGTQPGRYEDTTSILEFPDLLISGNRNFFVGPNLTVVPEPTRAMMLATAAFAGMVLRRRRIRE